MALRQTISGKLFAVGLSDFVGAFPQALVTMSSFSEPSYSSALPSYGPIPTQSFTTPSLPPGLLSHKCHCVLSPWVARTSAQGLAVGLAAYFGSSSHRLPDQTIRS